MQEGAILVVDDAEVFESAAPVLQRELPSHPLLHESSLSGALAVIDSHRPLELVIADWDLGGASLLHAMRADHETHHTPFIVTSRTDADEIIAAAMRLGATDHLAKPFLEKGLVSKLRRITKSQERRRLRRVRPPAEVVVRVQIEGVGELRLPLVDLSLTGCQLRVPATVAERLRIYQSADIELLLDTPLALTGELIRLTHDQEGRGHSILVAFRITGVAAHDPFKALLDDWRDAARRAGVSE